MWRLKVKKTESGGALLTALVFVVIISTAIAGIATLSVSHFSRASVEADNSNALLLADAGVNYELRYISENQLTGTPAHQAGSAYTGSIAGVEGTFTVWVTNDPDNGNSWSPPNNVIIHSTGTVGGVTRKVNARGSRQSIFDGFASYGYVAVTMGGTGTFVIGDIGTNGSLTLNGGTPGVSTGFDMYLAGPDASGVSGSNVISTPNPVNLPSIDPDIISRAPIVGFGTTDWNTISGMKSNPSMRKFAASAAAMTPTGTQNAGWPASGNGSTSIKSNDFNSMPSGPISVIADGDGTKRLVAAGTTGSTVENVTALILPSLSATTPTDYYFTDIDLSGSNVIIIDNAGWTSGVAGTVRIWMGPPGGANPSKDNIRSNVYFTDSNPVTFRLFYAKCSELTIAGNSYWYGGIYAVQKSCVGTPTIKITGGSKIFGSVMANYIVMSGGSRIIFPANGIIDNPGDFSLWFGFKDRWIEVPAGSGSVFYDGTNK